MADKGKDSDYFRLPDPFWMFLVIFGIYIMVCSLYKPDWVPFDYLGPLGALARYLANDQPLIINILIVFTVVVHTSYLFYSIPLARRKGLSTSAQVKWALSIFVFGGFSLIHLRGFEPKQKD